MTSSVPTPGERRDLLAHLLTRVAGVADDD